VTIDHDAEEPLYLQLAAVLRGQIASGELERRVPSVKTLTQQYGVAQGTAERALAVLREEGLIRSRMGRGHFVVPPGERPLGVGSRSRVLEDARGQPSRVELPGAHPAARPRLAAVLAVGQASRISALTNANTRLSRQIATLSAAQAAISNAEKTRTGAVTASLGVCEATSTETLNNYTPPVTVITAVTVSSPTLTNGVASCPYRNFVPMAPQPPPGG
jgi:DNA-binding transcriptional regulator YhcF (GntR family)